MMKKGSAMKSRALKLSLYVATGVVTSQVHAQSSVTLYGLMDAGLTYTNNVTTNSGRANRLQMTTGSSQGDRWGLRGSENIGSGNSINFVLENGYHLNTGTLGQGGLEFGRLAYLSASGDWGTFSMGRQDDFIGDIFPAYAIGSNTPAGLLEWGIESYAAGGYSLDNRVWGVAVNNAVKYVTPTVSGFSAGAMYGFGNTAGSVGTNSSISFVVSYNRGPLSGSLSYYNGHNIAAGGNVNEWAAGLAYNIDKARIFGLLTTVEQTAGKKPRATTAEVGSSYYIRPYLNVAGGFTYQARNHGVGSANQITLSADYFLSKATDVYVVVADERDSGFHGEVEAAEGLPSTTHHQAAIRVGMRHKF
ncbi:porin [Burkholderia metallica]|uniref:porin n=1 Tax=Burkholderia metallica TaxID=488729 RepID=UPI0020C73D1A|nr:porin [Burkholderia metallica]